MPVQEEKMMTVNNADFKNGCLLIGLEVGNVINMLASP